ncbi:alkaline phosphatase D family protein [Maribacter halichondriae]|uniref:alkaline phosphatase D family protein n=1 Tax=Maribacter halichondriae TaxID=2980554 RepID=UPI00235865D3|nr:alkaline phosphatase D family protein [Maribacter sp. Hal144]
MRYFYSFLALLIFAVSCKSAGTLSKKEILQTESSDFTIAFGSCNKTDKENLLWDDIWAVDPDIWIWGGDNIYADTDDMEKLRAMYQQQNQVAGYASLKEEVPIIGTWDDHDYGLNDGGVEFSAKKESQQEFLDFLKVPKNSPRRSQEGVYNSHDYKTEAGHIKVLVLDTRYFRTALTPDTETKKRTKPNSYGKGTVLGAEQWKWFEKELNRSKADFNIIVSSIQVLSNEHGFETWGNFPHEVEKLEKLISDSRAKGIIVLSGDRHISEFSKKSISGLDYPLIDFTSSGLTHAYRDFSGEPNPFRVGEVVFTESFGVLEFDIERRKVQFKMIGNNGTLLQTIEQSY